MTTTPQARSTPELANDVVNDVTTLMKAEAELARSEVNESLSQAMAGIASLLTSVAVLIAGLTVVLFGLGAGLVEWFAMTPWLAHMIAGGLGLALGAVLVMSAKAALKPENLAPKRTAANLKKDVRVVRESI